MTYKTDAQLHREVLAELAWDMRVDETDVGVEVDQGVVTLTGTVTSFAKSSAAEHAAHRVLGVLDVANDVNVKTPGTGSPTDTEIAQAIREALRWNVFVDDSLITSTVHNGYVTLEGTVDAICSRDDATSAVRPLKGVHAVANRINVLPVTLHPGEVRSAIKDALKRRADAAAHDVSIKVDEHEVVLDGRVPSWIEKQTIIEAAGHVRGITRVVDHINVVPMQALHLSD